MTIHKFGNCKLNPANLPPVESGDSIEEWNCCLLQPHTAIYAGKTGLTFRGCNLTNCDVPADSIFERCLRVHKSFCSHVHPEWVPFGLDGCVTVCAHVVDTDEVRVDGALVDTIYHYANTRVS